MERYTCFDADSLRSYTSTVALDDYPPPNPPEELITSFPRPPSGTRNLDNVAANSPRTSIKTLRRNYMVHELPLLQEPNPWDGSDQFHPVQEAGCSYDLIVPFDDSCEAPLHSLERLADIMFSPEHMLSILNNPRYLARFREFLLEERPRSLELLTYYLNTRKALKAIEYANALVRCAVDLPPSTIAVTEQVGESCNPALQRRVHETLQALTDEELPAFITSRCIGITSRVVEKRVRGTLPRKFQGTSDALAEVFCLTDPSRRDNPIIFASEGWMLMEQQTEFHRTTQYGMDYVLGRNCRFLQGPNTNPNSVRRIREAIKAGRHHSELFLNYRRDGSPFMNLLQCAPLCDSQGTVRYFIGAQIDVSGLAMEGAQMDSLCALLNRQKNKDAGSDAEDGEMEDVRPDEFRELSELFSPRELNVVHQVGGNLFKPVPAVFERYEKGHSRTWSAADTVEMEAIRERDIKTALFRGSLTGVYENYLLVRPYPSLRILFTSPALQIPGILQSSFLSRIGGSPLVREELLDAFMAGRSVTARVKWVTRFNPQGRDRWVHSPKSAQFLRRRSARASQSRPKATVTRSRVTRSRPATQHKGLSVVIPVKADLNKKKKDGEKRTDNRVSVEIANKSPWSAIDIASHPLDLEEVGEWNDLDSELPPDPFLPNDTRVTQARAAYDAGQYRSLKAAAAAWGISQTILKHGAKGPRPSRREAAHSLQKLDATDEDSIDDRRPTNVLIWEVANDLYRDNQWPQRFLLIEARKAPPRAPRPGVSSGPHPWRFAEDASSIVDDDFSKFDIPKTEAECATYFRQIRSGPAATAVRLQRFLTHLLVEQAKSVDMLSRPNETAPQGFVAAPASDIGTGVGNSTAAPSQPSQSISQPPTDNIPQRQEAQVPQASMRSEERETMARQAFSASLPLPTNPLAQPQPPQDALNTASSTPILSNTSSTYTSTPSRPSITTFQQFSRNHISQPSQPPDQSDARELQQPQGTADSTPVIGNALGKTAAPLQSSMESFQSSSAQDPSLPLQSLHTQEAQRDEATADSNPTLDNASPAHPSETFNSTLSSYQPSTTSIPQLLHHSEPQQSHEPDNSEDAANSLSLLGNSPPSHAPASLETLLSSFQTYPTTHKPQKPPKLRKPSQPRKPQQPRARNPQQPQPQQPQQSQQPHYQQQQQQQQQHSSPYHSGNFATSYGSSQPTRPQYYPNEYLLRTAVDQSSKRRRIDDPIHSINHPGYQ
ncbi:hypothetical protein BDV39DRAFT_216925 [Aspergillus sergii]|uniref:PAC domain-containing protein n=1 Tax=Aspergillus sergii TaxID=1034303 RepID=A0A5N6WZU4_9EURO|nr:hypothetical protein BDV39DRAFT_216925 [Aspergillus sergii]